MPDAGRLPEWRVAVLVPAASVAVLFILRRLSKWLWLGVERSFGQVVLTVMAPDMARIGVRIAQSLDELREANTADHIQTGFRLTAVELAQIDVETRLAAVELKLNIRPADLRTRRTDIDGAHNG